jgi:two-component system nitrogen regulation sensor histidine kinase GlnL
MTLISIAHFLGIAISFSTGAFVFLTNPRRRTNQFFLMLSILLTIWLIFMAIAFLYPDVNTVAMCVRGCMMAGAMIPLSFDWLRVSIIHPEKSRWWILTQSPLWLMASLIIGAVSLTRIFVLGATPSLTGVDLHVIPDPVYSPAFPLYSAFQIINMGLLIYRFVGDLRKTRGIQKTELQFILLGSGSSVFIGIFTALVIPVITENSQSVQFTPLSVICLYVVIAYGIATRRIMDVAYIMRRLTAYALLIVYLVALYAGVWALLNRLLEAMWVPFTALAYFIASLAVAISLAPANGLMQRLASRLFIHLAPLDMNHLAHSANILLRSINRIDTLLAEFSTLLMSTVGTDRICILINVSGNHEQWFPVPERPPGLSFPADSALPAVLFQAEGPLVPELLYRVKPEAHIKKACRLLEEKGFAAAVGLRSQEGLEGLVLLGPRLSGTIYGTPEQQAVQLLCNHLAVALNNARLYTQLQDGKIYNDILVDSLVSGIIAANQDGIITVFNREAQRITQLPSDKTVNHSLFILPHSLQTLLTDTISHSEGLRDQEISISLPRGDSIPIRVSSSVFYGHSGKMLGALLVMTDLTTVRQLELQVRRTDRLASLGTLAAGMAHEIKNPLVSIKTFTQLLPERYDDADFRDTFSSLVGGEVKRIDSIVNQLLRFSRPSKPILAPSSLHEILGNSLKLIQQQLHSKNIQLVSSFTLDSDRINADGDQLGQAFINFLLNAIESMPNGGTLTVTTLLPPRNENTGNHPAPTIRVSIQDTGSGITSENLSHVFDPFFTTKSQGTGLGLSVAHGIIQEHSGSIDIQSQVGQGTTFILTFPVIEEAKPS